jgi:peptidyl-prolyl cis-trans isomerase B (cyclophilin B)
MIFMTLIVNFPAEKEKEILGREEVDEPGPGAKSITMPDDTRSLDPEVAILSTSAGTMKIAFWPDVAPLTVQNFKKLAREGFYDGTAFHRIVKGFMIQGGDPLSRGENNPLVGTGGPGYAIKGEFHDRPHRRGVISMARASDPNSGGSQFFICLEEAGFLDGQYAAFGEVIEGEEVLMAIGETPTSSQGGEQSKPQRRVTVENIRIVPREPAAG